MKNLLLVLLALPGWVAAQTDSAIRYIEIVDTAVPLLLKEETSTSVCHVRHLDEKGIQTEPHWCHDHSHCIHQHRHRVSEEDHAAACAEQCQYHGNYKLQVFKEAARLLDRPQIWPEDHRYSGWKATLRMPFPFMVYGRNVHSLGYWSDIYFDLEDEAEDNIMSINVLDMRSALEKLFDSAPSFKYSEITYQTDGQPGDRILKVQLLGVRRYFSDTLITQTWLHEATNEVSVHYVKMPFNKRDEHVEISVWAACGHGEHEIFIAGLANAPMVRCSSQYMCGMPENGTVYTFKPVHLVLPERQTASVQVPAFQVMQSPQSGLHQLVGLVGTDELLMYDGQGRLVKRIQVAQARQGFALDDLAAGAYLLHDPLYGQSVRLTKP